MCVIAQKCNAVLRFRIMKSLTKNQDAVYYDVIKTFVFVVPN